jgi:transposase
MPVIQVAQAYRVDRATVHRWLARVDKAGVVDGLRRSPGSGRPPKLAQLTHDHWRDIVLEPASVFGFETDFWTAQRVRQVVCREYGVLVSTRTILRRLRRAGLTCQKPEREYFEADPEVREQWLEETLPKIRAAIKEHRALLYCQDEASLSLTALLGKTWAPRGQTPKQCVRGNRGTISAISAINGRGRLVFRLHEKRIASAEVIDFLGQLLRHHARRHLVVVMDQAPPHVSKATMAYIASQVRLHVFHLPPYSPDWNPDEKVWNHLKHQELKGHQATTKSELLELSQRKLQSMADTPELLRGIYFRCCVADLLS